MRCWVLGVGLISVFDTKVIHNKREGEITCHVLPESRSDRDRLIAVGSEELRELIVGNFAGLWEAVYALMDFNIDKALVDERCKSAGSTMVVKHSWVHSKSSGSIGKLSSSWSVSVVMPITGSGSLVDCWFLRT